MKYLKTVLLVGAFLVSGCDQSEINNTIVSNSSPPNTVKDQPEEPDRIVGYKPLEEHKIDGIKRVISLFAERDVKKISNIIRFPLDREYPIPPIKNKKEFQKRFAEVFDEVLINKIATSTIDQWVEVGWRGIMLDSGSVWMANSDGIITGVTYQSEVEKKLRGDLINKEKESLHVSLKTFESPTHKIITKNHLIRIDELIDDKYRYASWKRGTPESSKPDLILDNGVLEFQGSGGSYIITFLNGDHTYTIYRNVIGSSDTPAVSLEIEKDGKVIAEENGRLH